MLCLEQLNKWWVFLIAAFLLYAIIKKICKINEPFDQDKFIKQYQNQKRLGQKLSLKELPKGLPTLASFYVGLN
jgi:hypothetical protein